MTKIPLDDILESLYKLRIRESEQLKTVLELYDMKIHQKISMPNYQKLKTMVKRRIDQKLRFRNFDARSERIETRAVVTSRRGLSGVERGQRVCYQWKAKGQCSRGDKCSFRHYDDKCAKPTAKTLHPLNHQNQEEEVRREKRASEARVHLGSSLDSRAKTYLNVFAPNHFVTIGILPNINFYKSESACKFGEKLRLRTFDARHEKIETGAVVKSHRGLSCVERGRGIC